VTRRFALAAGLLAVVASLSSCSTFNRSDAAAEIKGEQLTRSELNQLSGGVTDGDTVRGTITKWLQLGVLGGTTAGIGSSAELDARMKDAIATISAPFMDAAKANYELGLKGAPLLCLRAIPVTSPTTTDEVLTALQSGMSFADAAKKYSSDPSLAANGGLIADANGQACLDPTTLNPSLIQLLNANKAVPGTPVAIAFNNQKIVLLLRPFDDLTAAEKVGFAQKEISAELKARLAKSKVFVNSRYGRWDVATATVVALGNG
jgi:hypothetical protein